MAALFTDTNRTAIDPDVLATIPTEIVDLIFAASTAPDRATVATIIDQLPLSAYCGKPNHRFPIQTSAGITTAFEQQVTAKGNKLIL